MRTPFTALICISIASTGCVSQRPHPSVPDPALPTKWRNDSDAVVSAPADWHAFADPRLKLSYGLSGYPLLATEPAEREETSSVSERAAPMPGAGWSALADPKLNGLISRALTVNRDLIASAIRLQRAQLQSEYVGQDALPTLALSGGASVQKTLKNSSAASAVQIDGISYFIQDNVNVHSYFVSAGLGYELDLWSRVARLRNAEDAASAAAAADLDAARLVLVTSVAQHYWRIALVDEEIAAAVESVEYAKQMLSYEKVRHEAGMTDERGVLNADVFLASSRTALDALKQVRLEEAHALAMLLDVSPGEFDLTDARLPMESLPDVAAGLPVDLLDRRPDLRAARLRLDEATHRLKAAESARYPRFSLTAGVNTGSTTLHDLLKNPIGSVGLNVMLPFIDWNRTAIVRDDFHMQYIEAAVAFRDTLYKALSEVERTLASRNTLAKATLAASDTLESARREEALALRRYEAGATAKRVWLDAQEKRRRAALDLSRQRVAELDNLVMLYKALGQLM